MNEITGYVNTVKPYHTKVKSTLESYKATDKVTATFDELARTMKVTMKNDDLLDHTQYDYDARIITSSFTSTPVNIISGGSFTSPPTDVIQSIAFNSPSNLNNVFNEHRRSNATPSFTEQVSVKITTNTSGNVVDANTRTYSYVQDNWLNTAAFSLREDRESTIATDVEVTDTTITLATGHGVKFNTLGGLAYINGEIVKYTQVSDDILINITRAMFGTINRSHSVGALIVDVTNEQLDIFKTLKTVAVNGQYLVNQRFDYRTGKSILDATAEDIVSQELQESGKGIS